MADCTEDQRLNEEQRDFGLLERHQIVAELYLKGKVQALIAKEVGVTQQQVSNDLKAIRAAWLAAGIRDFDAIKSEQLAKLDVLETTYWDAWERSKTQKTRSTTKRKSTPVGDKKGEAVTLEDEAALMREDQVGDPRYLAGVESVIDKRCKIFGFYSPVKIDVRDIDAQLEQAFIEALAGRTEEQPLASELKQ